MYSEKKGSDSGRLTSNSSAQAEGNNTAIIQRKLSVGAVDDPLEYEADAMADQVMRMPEPTLIQRKCSRCEDEEAQRKPLTSFIQKKEAGGKSTASNAVHHQIQSTKGAGNAMPRATKTFMENRFGTDFSGVRIHSGAYASRLSHELNAQAFTVGNDIYFNEGKFSPESSEGKRLLAHELVHTIQQNAAIERKLIQRSCVAPAICTWGGEWKTTKYNKLIDANAKGPTNPALGVRGADIELDFTPGDNTDAELIGLVQTAKAINRGAVTYIGDPTREAHGIKSADSIEIDKITKETDEGTHVDQFGAFENPLYATGTAKATDALSDTATSAGWGQHGMHYTDTTKTLKKQDAILKDTPVQADVKTNSSNVFEVAALAIKGNQSGTYYGSVRWGWKTDGTGNLDLIPLEAIAKEVPSSSFIKAAGLWNKGKTSSGTDTIDLPMPDIKVTTKPISDIGATPTPLSSSGFQIPAGTRVQIITEGSTRLDGTINNPRIKVVDGIYTQKILTITLADLSSLKTERT